MVRPLTPSRVFVASIGLTSEVTAATNGREVLLVTGHWGTDLIDLTLLDARGHVVGGPLETAGRVGANRGNGGGVGRAVVPCELYPTEGGRDTAHDEPGNTD